MYKVCVQDVWIQVLATVESPNLEKSVSITLGFFVLLLCLFMCFTGVPSVDEYNSEALSRAKVFGLFLQSREI